MSNPTTMKILTEVGLPVAMRDGVVLRADVYRPDVDHPVPALLMRTPYRKDLALGSPFSEGLRLVREGFALVIQDVRGRGDSEGVFYPFRAETDDGLDTFEWVAGQPWCSGSLGTIGASYVGATQWLPARANPPALKAMAPIVTGADYRDGWIYRGGAFELGFCLQWTLSIALEAADRLDRETPGSKAFVDRVRDAQDRIEALYPGFDADAEDLIERLAPFYGDWRAHPVEDEDWPAIAPNPSPATTLAPALDIGGWYDIFLVGTLANFVQQRAAARAAGRPGPRLVVGPWAHGVYSGRFHERRFGVRSQIDVAGIVNEQIRWFDQHLRGGPEAASAPVRLFILGLDQWRDFDDWPPASATPSTLYLSPTDPRDQPGGGLLVDPPASDQAAIQISFDPGDPVPTLGGSTLFAGSTIGERVGPADLAQLESRSDVRTFTSAPFERDRLLIGPIAWQVSADATTESFDLVAHLADVGPSGQAELLTGSILRVQPEQRGGSQRVELGATAALIKAGHRLRLYACASDFPRFDLNPLASAAGGAVISLSGKAGYAPRLELLLDDLPLD